MARLVMLKLKLKTNIYSVRKIHYENSFKAIQRIS